MKKMRMQVKKLFAGFMAVAMLAGAYQIPVSAGTNQKDKTQFLLNGDDKGESSMDKTFEIGDKQYTYMGWVTVDGAVAAQKYLQFTYKGDITYMRIEFETPAPTPQKTPAYWMNKDQADHFVSADGKDIPLKASKETTVTIDLAKTGIKDISKYAGMHLHNGDALLAANKLVITDAKLLTTLKTEEKPIEEQPIIQPVTKKTQTITAKNISKTYGAKAFSIAAKLTSGDGKLSYVSSDKKVAVIDANGKVTLKGTGKTTITIKAAETTAYKAATKAVTITVNPKKAVLSSAKNTAKKTVNVKWSKDKNASGYQVRYATDKKFKKNVKTLGKITSSKSTSKKITKLTKGKTYYVQVRAYKLVNNKAIYGDWSKYKAVKITK